MEKLSSKPLDPQSLVTLRKYKIDYFVILIYSQTGGGRLRLTARLERIAEDDQWNIVAPRVDFLPDKAMAYGTLAQEVYAGISQDRGGNYQMHTAPVKFCSAASVTRTDVKDVPEPLLERFRKRFMEQRPWYIEHVIETQCPESGTVEDGVFVWLITVRERGNLLYFHVKMIYGAEFVCEDDSPDFDSADALKQRLDQVATDMVGSLRLTYDNWTPSTNRGKPLK